MMYTGPPLDRRDRPPRDRNIGPPDYDRARGRERQTDRQTGEEGDGVQRFQKGSYLLWRGSQEGSYSRLIGFCPVVLALHHVHEVLAHGPGHAPPGPAPPQNAAP